MDVHDRAERLRKALEVAVAVAPRGRRHFSEPLMREATAYLAARAGVTSTFRTPTSAASPGAASLPQRRGPQRITAAPLNTAQSTTRFKTLGSSPSAR